MYISESRRCYNVIPSVNYFHVTTKMLADFQICILYLQYKTPSFLRFAVHTLNPLMPGGNKKVTHT